MKRLTWHWKIQQGAEAEDIINKEMSLAGVQIPMDNYFLEDAKEFFRMGEFAGWVIEY
jgi:tRNA (cmo5U34)-methyltransferase